MMSAHPDAGHIARYGQILPDGRVMCTLCPHHCRLSEGQRGRCFVRACQDGHLVLTTYGRSSGFCVDPIEKKPLYHFLPGTAILSFGTAGCNLRCAFCQNWSLSGARQMEVLATEALPSDIAHAAKALGCRSVAFTYNEPLIFLEYAVDVAAACHEIGIKTVAVTAGYVCEEPRREFFSHMDAANIDLKAFRPDFYKEHCGGDLKTVQETLLYVCRETNVWVELTTLLIPSENDSPEEIDQMTRWIVRELGPDVPMHFTAFHPAHHFMNRPVTPLATLKNASEIATRNGVRYVYTGNVRDADGGITFCHACGHSLIERVNYDLTQWRLDIEGRCAACGAPCAGLFSGAPGDWGSRCLPVNMKNLTS